MLHRAAMTVFLLMESGVSHGVVEDFCADDDVHGSCLIQLRKAVANTTETATSAAGIHLQRVWTTTAAGGKKGKIMKKGKKGKGPRPLNFRMKKKCKQNAKKKCGKMRSAGHLKKKCLQQAMKTCMSQGGGLVASSGPAGGPKKPDGSPCEDDVEALTKKLPGFDCGMLKDYFMCDADLAAGPLYAFKGEDFCPVTCDTCGATEEDKKNRKQPDCSIPGSANPACDSPPSGDGVWDTPEEEEAGEAGPGPGPGAGPCSDPFNADPACDGLRPPIEAEPVLDESTSGCSAEEDAMRDGVPVSFNINGLDFNCGMAAKYKLCVHDIIKSHCPTSCACAEGDESCCICKKDGWDLPANTGVRMDVNGVQETCETASKKGYCAHEGIRGHCRKECGCNHDLQVGCCGPLPAEEPPQLLLQQEIRLA